MISYWKKKSMIKINGKFIVCQTTILYAVWVSFTRVFIPRMPLITQTQFISLQTHQLNSSERTWCLHRQKRDQHHPSSIPTQNAIVLKHEYECCIIFTSPLPHQVQTCNAVVPLTSRGQMQTQKHAKKWKTYTRLQEKQSIPRLHRLWLSAQTPAAGGLVGRWKVYFQGGEKRGWLVTMKKGLWQHKSSRGKKTHFSQQ